MPRLAFDAFEPARLAMGDTVRYAERARLIEMQPWRDLCSSAVPEIDPTHVKPAHLLTRVATERWPSAVNGQAQAR